jgi:hypothetical protein
MPYHVLEPFRSVITDCKCPHYATLFAINAVFEHFSTLFEFEEYENTRNYAFLAKIYVSQTATGPIQMLK